ncbi:ATP-binding cassette domain-containing protein [Bacillus mojavensis]|uniref:ATP-binding cassette domain-containing protein n=1 Tax=Bacillus mojavensis TaxID=72360 RepID=UPI002DBC96A9|nr:ATP-binding cassette domain-containing protein [Bacillus mojavensis]MEC1668264.1 ATP-binding cassette domain-containing protein [Bacillus mojavensis]MEC1738119.1 ATP-binding cassette domain-containing protein [Bacillus mojavensis]MEC1793828.1 ATP-binding cassette domain-containing protein [Bacillus mojavensis]
MPDKDYKERMSNFISMLEMEGFLDTPVRQSSLGLRMKGEVVAAFIHHAKILLLDEPTIGLGYRCEK